MEILDVEGHCHKVLATEGSQRKRIFSEGLHVLANWFGEESERA